VGAVHTLIADRAIAASAKNSAKAGLRRTNDLFAINEALCSVRYLDLREMVVSAAIGTSTGGLSALGHR